MNPPKYLKHSSAARRAARVLLVAAGCFAVAAGAAVPTPAPAKTAKVAKTSKAAARPATSPYARAAQHQARGPQSVGGQTPTAAQAGGAAKAHSPRATAKRH
jgi:hypothetical protein